ncbi:MAG: ABC transporter substrate-binding protein [Verrucomicrobiales bacterium]|nr:ABC transporter substrate-binding protein [Verrucomicrobiales bacterium]|tara:strand:+ start:442 stop:1359 length:918 start_codon:yes stop_codon:yes gene_type:complete
MIKNLRLFILTIVGFFLVGCGGNKKEPNADGKINVVATTTMITDMVKQIGGDKINLKSLMGPGVDPHLYDPVPTDAIALTEADVIFYNGLKLEGQMSSDLKKLDGIALSSAINKGLIQGDESYPDPHIWGNPTLWSNCIPLVVDALSEQDSKNAEYYKSSGAKLIEKYKLLHSWAIERVSGIGEEARILITSHDAFEYFGNAYGFKVVGLQGISTATEAGISERVKLVDFIKENKVKAIFVESSVSPDAIKSIAEDSGAMIGGELFSDAMGEPGEMESFNGDRYDLGTYEGMIKHNINTVVDSLK